MKRKKKRRYKKNELISKRMIMFIVIIAIIALIYFTSANKNKENASVNAFSSINEIVDEIETGTYANINRYIVYGTHFNIEGDMDISGNNSIESAKVVAKTASGEEIGIDTEYTYENNQISFSTLKEINTGLDLESLKVEDYYILLKVEFSNNETKYYSLTNDTEYGNIEYYTLTRNHSNNRINIDFTTIDNMPILGFHITTVKELPDDVYDVVIDPGHGGSDVGAVNGRYMESEIALDCALELKKQLEDIGLKVLLTRDGTESEEEYTMYNIYDKDGRVTMANESHAKILISLHLNSNLSDNVDGGVEIYASSNSDLTFAKKLADDIVETAKTEYSTNQTDKIEDGVYVRTIEVEDQKNEASFSRENYKGIFDSIPYLYIIREIGGIATGAYVDGTNKAYGANEYRNSNVGIEGYLVELGYINVDEDLDNILENADLYAQAITNSITNFYGIK